jgi:hypothetical protein
VYREAPDDAGLMVPDVHVVGEGSDSRRGAAAVAPAPVRIPLAAAGERRLRSIRIVRRQDERLVLSLELLSPVNKRGEGRHALQRKRRRLRNGGAHLMEVDLLREGQRVIDDPSFTSAHYAVTLIRADAEVVEAWPLSVRDALPVVPVPLLDGDEVALDLGAALDEANRRARYSRVADYSADPPGPFNAADRVWVRERVAQFVAARAL